MSETVKLIIEIPKSALELLNTTGVDWLGAEHILSAVAEGIPLNDIKAELERANRMYPYTNHGILEAIAILDNIGKGDSK